ncbi:hypothetical protein VPH35_063304 [Triticum aestivum]|uniref:Uncharacterized protein n=1 Tax=Aegilops tauschii TaxID=37682 RepID=M8BYS6_AEGTA
MGAQHKNQKEEMEISNPRFLDDGAGHDPGYIQPNQKRPYLDYPLGADLNQKLWHLHVAHFYTNPLMKNKSGPWQACTSALIHNSGHPSDSCLQKRLSQGQCR